MSKLPPITLPEGRRLEGTLFDVPVQRLTKKSAFLRRLDKPKRQDKATGNVVQINRGKGTP